MRPGPVTALQPAIEHLITPMDEYIRRQQDMSAVERYAMLHDADELPSNAVSYQALLPAAPPAPGQQYRFEVDLDLCTSCKACVSACKSLNGLDDDESWRSVATLVGVDAHGPTQQTVTSACHHCVDPACLKGCPVDAYSKDPHTGIVAHHDDQCIGCTYCIWTCPYEVPRFNARLGVVRKCDMCQDRLAVGEAPACVQACPNGAIAIGVVDVAELRNTLGPDDTLVPTTPPSRLTVPSTRYRRTVALPDDATSTDTWTPRPNHAHAPLVAMLVATQTAVGVLLATAIGAAIGGFDATTTRSALLVSGVLQVGGVAASVSHLGRPRQAWRAVLGIGHSWLSREIAAFGILLSSTLGATVATFAFPGQWATAALRFAAAFAGIGAVACSVMVYVVTRRAWWSATRTMAAFATTTVVAGSATTAVILGATGTGAQSEAMAAVAMSAAAIAIVAIARLRAATTRDATLADGALLEKAHLPKWRGARDQLLFLAGVVGPLLILALVVVDAPRPLRFAVALATGLGVLAGESAGRVVFFRAMTAPRMPGPEQ